MSDAENLNLIRQRSPSCKRAARLNLEIYPTMKSSVESSARAFNLFGATSFIKSAYTETFSLVTRWPLQVVAQNFQGQ